MFSKKIDRASQAKGLDDMTAEIFDLYSGKDKQYKTLSTNLELLKAFDKNNGFVGRGKSQTHGKRWIQSSKNQRGCLKEPYERKNAG